MGANRPYPDGGACGVWGECSHAPDIAVGQAHLDQNLAMNGLVFLTHCRFVEPHVIPFNQQRRPKTGSNDRTFRAIMGHVDLTTHPSIPH